MIKKTLMPFCLTIIFGLFWSSPGHAMPNFARKYSADCTMCHTHVPRLNRTGYEFRLAGFRLPSEIGKEEKAFNLGDFFAARLQEQYRYAKHRGDVIAENNVTASNLEFFEFTLYPLTGSWAENFASIGEFSMAPGGEFEVENAYVRSVWGSQNGWFQARAGVMHPWEGFQASDRPIGTTRPLFQRSRAAGSPFVLWALDESAAEIGYYLARSGTSLAARVSNGILWKKDGSGSAEPAQGGDLNKGTSADLGGNRKSYGAFINQFITENSAVSLYWYQGTIPFVDPNFATVPDNTLDTFTRTAVYANFWVLPGKINLLGGYAWGKDDLDRTITVTATDPELGSKVFDGTTVGDNDGYFGEIDFHGSANLALAARYDFFDPSDKTDDDRQTAVSVAANYYVRHGLLFIADYQLKETEQAGADDKKDDLYQVRMIFIW